MLAPLPPITKLARVKSLPTPNLPPMRLERALWTGRAPKRKGRRAKWCGGRRPGEPDHSLHQPGLWNGSNGSTGCSDSPSSAAWVVVSDVESSTRPWLDNEASRLASSVSPRPVPV